MSGALHAPYAECIDRFLKMEQIYYTQCPIGYGLGASGGFQIKRLSPGYVISGDFRHFSLRAFVAETRQPAPAALRYRRGEGDVAEIAWLTPRSHEYETERGLWGRPGGHFAHGLQLSATELRELDDFPAGLFDQPFWTRSDPEPTRGEPPPDLRVALCDVARPGGFACGAGLAQGEDGKCLARLLAAVAAAARSGRTLFLIDEPARLNRRIALLTFAFPPPWRADLTFSTYHDRPQELPGFRIQGTIPAARPNRPALLAQGFVADLASGAGTIEPVIEPAGWARTLAGWFVRHQDEDQADWEALGAVARTARLGPASPWAEEWLERMFNLPRMIRQPAPVPSSARGWAELASWTAWAGQAGLSRAWAVARPPAWWFEASRGAGTIGSESRAALLEHLRLPDVWGDAVESAAWGDVVARWTADADEPARREAASAALSAAPQPLQPALAGRLIRSLPPEAAEGTARWLAQQSGWSPQIRLRLRAHSALASAIEVAEGHALQELLLESLTSSDDASVVFDALEAEARDRTETRTLLAEQLALALGTSTGRDELRRVLRVHGWALGLVEPGAANAWLAPYWERQFADRLNIDHWRAVFEKLPPDLARSAATVVLAIAARPRAVDEAFRWGIEDLVLPRDEAERPHDPAWPGLYLDRLPSGLDVLKRLVQKPFRRLGVARWLEAARDRGELSKAQAARLGDCQRYERVLRTHDARGLLEIKLPEVAPTERGLLLNQILRHLADGSDEALNLALDTCRAAWPGGFQPGAEGLALLAEALATPLLAERGYPDELWLGRLRRVLDRLGLVAELERGFEPNGLAAHIVAATTRHPGDTFDAWRFRASLLGDNQAWRTLAADICRDLEGVPPGESLKVLDDWDRALVKGRHTSRFYALWFNACDPAQLVAAVLGRAVEIRSFAIPWWEPDGAPGAVRDIRERLVRQAPMVPLRQGSVTTVLHWLRRPRGRSARSIADDFVPMEEDRVTEGAYEWLISDEGRARWGYLHELSLFAMAAPAARNHYVKQWHKELPLARLAASERYQFLASVIRVVDEDDPVLLAPLARWLLKGGVLDLDQIKAWNEHLAQVDPVPHDLVLSRVILVRRLCDELKTLRREQQERR
jgi:hypothetical protein